MKYYSIGRTNEIEIIGFYPQTKRAEGYHVDSVNNILPDDFPDYQPQYGLELNPKSIATDIIDRGILNFGMVLSDKFKKLLEKFNLPPHRFYPIEVLGTEIKYYWVHYVSSTVKFLDFKKCEFEVYNYLPPFEVEKDVKFEKYDEMMAFKKSLPYSSKMRYKLIMLSANFPNYDLFEIVGAQYFTLISNKLKEAIMKNGITGLEMVEYNNVMNATS